MGATTRIGNGNWVAGKTVIGQRGLGILAENIPNTGTNGTSPLYDSLQFPADIGAEVRWVLISPPTLGGTLVMGESGEMQYVGPPDSFTWQGQRNGVSVGNASVSFVGSGGASSVSSVSITPNTATGTQVFTATVAGVNSPSQSVAWSSSAGSISSSGIFNAPTVTGSVQTITVTATSLQDATKSASATVTIAAAVVRTVTSVIVAPTSSSVTAGTSQTFTAVVNGTNSPPQSVTWTASSGSIDSNGVFTAPAATLNIQNITITATSTFNSSFSGTAVVSVPTTTGIATTVSTVTLSPISASVAGGLTQQFTASVVGANSPSQSVLWSTNAGYLTSLGLFTAPASTSAQQNIIITATSVVDTSKSGSAVVSVPPVGVLVVIDNSIHKFSDNVVNRFGVVIGGATVQVTDLDTNLPAVLFRDRLQTPKYNPVIANSEGYFEFYVVSGHYRCDVSGYGVVPYTIDDIVFTDSSGSSIPRLPSFVVAALPDPTVNLNGMIYVSNGVSNRHLAISDGTNWRWADGTIVS